MRNVGAVDMSGHPKCDVYHIKGDAGSTRLHFQTLPGATLPRVHRAIEGCPAVGVSASGKHQVPVLPDTPDAAFAMFAELCRYFPGYEPVQRRGNPVTPRQAPRLQRVRVELRLFPATAEALYQRAAEWNVSVSEAGNRLIDTGLAGTANADEKA